MLRARSSRLSLLLTLSAVAACVVFGLGAWRLLAARAAVANDLEQERLALSIRAAGALADEIARCRTLATTPSAVMPADCSGATEGGSPFHWFVSPAPEDVAPLPPAKQDALTTEYRQRVKTDCASVATEAACGELAHAMATTPSAASSIVAYWGAQVMAALTRDRSHVPGHYELRARLERIVLEDTLRRHRAKIADSPTEKWLRLGPYLVTTQGGGVVAWSAAPGREAIRAFLVARKILDGDGYAFRLAPRAPATAPGSSAAFVDEQVGYLTVEEDDFGVRMTAARRSSEVLLAWFSVAALVMLGSLLLAGRSARLAIENVRQRENFVASVSHEFRTPLGGLALMLEALLSGRVTGDEKQRAYLEQMQRETERLVRLSENILALGRLQRGVGPQLQDWRVEELVSPVLERMAPQAKAQRIHVTSKTDAHLPRVRGDGELIRMALGNLLDNAIKFGPKDSQVTVSARRDGTDVCFSVEDQGPGIAAAEVKRIFDWFYRTGDELTREVQGTGLGLALTREVAQRHHGSIQVFSEPGHGARFELRLPALEES